MTTSPTPTDLDAVAGVDYDVSACPICGDPSCEFPPECQDAVGFWPAPTYGDEC